MSPGSKPRCARGFLMLDTLIGGMIATVILISMLFVFAYTAQHTYGGILSYKSREQGYDRLETAIREKVFYDDWNSGY